MKKTRLISFGTIIAALVNIGVNLIFIPIGGYLAAAITTTITYFILFLFHYFITTFLLKVNIYISGFHFKSFLFIIIITSYFFLFANNFSMRLIGILFSFILFFINYKKSLFFFFKNRGIKNG
jgi:O-antigen/teichoic acid export membrane protein